MSQAAPKHDVTVTATANPLMWVLVQTAPRLEILAASADRERLRSEMAELYGHDFECGSDPGFRLAIRPTNVLFG